MLAVDRSNDPYKKLFDAAIAGYTGSFDTGLECHCGAKIIDHATLDNPDAPPPGARNLIVGPGLSYRELVEQFFVHHRYWCDTCGAVFRGEVLGIVREYKTKEARIPVKRTPELLVLESETSIAAKAPQDF